MIEQVILRSCPKLLEQPGCEELQRQLFAMLGYAKQQPLTSRDDLYQCLYACVENRLGLLCEAVNTLDILDHKKVVHAMQMIGFSQLQPTPAHLFIAFLARESFVNEVITTNYDCCQEAAVFAVAGIVGKGTPPPGSEVTGPAVSIANLENYRRHSARRFDRGTRIAVLRVYKLNGCAGALAALLPYDPEGNYEDDILLTERQLQHMDDRSWAKDLLKDRIRSRAFVFSGFGSDEPQVRFTILRLLEEFKGNGGSGNKQGNSIWLHVYDQDLTFSQRQIMHSFWPRDEVMSHCFSAGDMQELKTVTGGDQEEVGFDANLFWQLLFCHIFLALQEQIRRGNMSGGDFFADLAEQDLQTARDTFYRWLDPGRRGAEILDA